MIEWRPVASRQDRSDPGTLVPGREFPRWMYHALSLPRMVADAQEERALGPEWSRTYIHQEYPKVKYHWNGKNVTVKNAEEEAALRGGWANAPGAFDAYKGARRASTSEHNPTKWVEEWSVPGLSSGHRSKIKAQLLRADALFERWPDPESGALEAMRQAFDGIAGVLWEAGVLTESLLRNELPEFIWDSAIAAGWWRAASETRQDIFPERIGHYWVWRDDSRDWNGLFRSETAVWEAMLLEAPPRATSAAAAAPTDRPESQASSLEAESLPEHALPSTPAGAATDSSGAALLNESSEFISVAQREAAIAEYTKHWTCSGAALARAARVHPADLSKWKKGSLPAQSDKKARIEKVLQNDEAPVPSKGSPDY
jgi:hypothetical protein